MVRFASCIAVLLVVLFTPLAFGQEAQPPGDVTIITPVVPPPSTDWVMLVAIGSGYVFAIVALLRQAVPKVDGWYVPAAVVPIAVGVALYQVGYSDLKLTGKHAGMLYLTAYGGVAGLKKLGGMALAAIAAWRAGEAVPPPPSFGSESQSIEAPPAMPTPPTKPAPKQPPTLGGMVLCLVLAGCASPIHMAAAVNNVAADTLNEAAPRLRKHCVDEVATLPTREALEARRLDCEPLTLSYDSAATAVGALRAALLAAAGGDESQLAGAVAKVVAVAGELAKKMGAMK